MFSCLLLEFVFVLELFLFALCLLFVLSSLWLDLFLGSSFLVVVLVFCYFFLFFDRYQCSCSLVFVRGLCSSFNCHYLFLFFVPVRLFALDIVLCY